MTHWLRLPTTCESLMMKAEPGWVAARSYHYYRRHSAVSLCSRASARLELRRLTRPPDDSHNCGSCRQLLGVRAWPYTDAERQRVRFIRAGLLDTDPTLFKELEKQWPI